MMQVIYTVASWLFSRTQVLIHFSSKGKAVPLQARTGPEDSWEVGVPRFRDNGTGWW